ncbi:MAG: photosynthetic reaction center subunit M [Chloroflexaceae bacterium]|nr:photosynthetic reaction center subunit M [Chloroflexaceae bacterium]
MSTKEFRLPPERPTTDLNIGGVNGRWGGPLFIEKGFIGKVLTFFGENQIGPLYLGLWGTIAFASGGIFLFIWLLTMASQVGYNPVAFVKYFVVLQLDPPPSSYGLSWPPLEEGGWWLIATFFLTISMLAWTVRLWTRATALGLKPYLAFGYIGALALYFVIYFIRPVIMGSWAEACPHGIKALLDWTNNVSVRYGNFYYNPFHMLSIFFLLGSTLLLSMHGATIWATEKYGAHEEIEEIEAPGTGTERAQLLWRWVMGFNANAYSIHLWAYWFAWLCGVTGAIGLLLSGTLVHDWFQWAIEAKINYPQVLPPDVILPPQ